MSLALDAPTIDPSLLGADAQGRVLAEFVVADMHCASCLSRVEALARSVNGVDYARANLTARRLSVRMRTDGRPEDVLAALLAGGRDARPFDASLREEAPDRVQLRQLTSAMAVAGFASANVMLLSVSVWSGAEGSTRDLFHWLSAAIAIPTILYSGRPFFRSAWKAVSHGTTNMDVPISLGVIGATALSLYETMTGGNQAWFDGSVMLLFFLLVGRVLDQRMRTVARASAARLLSLPPSIAALVEPSGALRQVPIRDIAPDDVLRIRPGERIAIDGVVTVGTSDIDRSFLTGESTPEAVRPGMTVHAGAMNVTGPLDIRATTRNTQTVLADIARLMEKVERPDGVFVRLADRAAHYYTPVVHIAALATFCAWLVLGQAIHPSLTAAVAVLIITCPCALGLAVPAVQIVAAGRLLRDGVILKDGAGLEKLSDISLVAFDKTGTLTLGRSTLLSGPDDGSAAWPVAHALAAASRHPLSQALAEAAQERAVVAAPLREIREHPGLGVSARLGAVEVRLGRRDWACPSVQCADDGEADVWLCLGDSAEPCRFTFQDRLRPDAVETVRRLRTLGLDIALLSGDRAASAARVARQCGIDTVLAGCLPGDKVDWLTRQAATGQKVLMVGDGLNDAPALAAAHVSISPGSAADIAQAASDFVFSGDRLAPVLSAVMTARSARSKIRQNFALAVGYNVLAVPVAMLGLATPLIAAVSMSLSSIIVIGNALALPKSRLARRP